MQPIKRGKPMTLSAPVGTSEERIALDEIRLDGGTQPRAQLNPQTVEDYAEDMQRGDVFRPVVLYYDGRYYWLSDGFHRVTAARKAGLSDIAAEVRQGSQTDAQWHSYSVNKDHGLRRTNDDKRRAVLAALEHPKGAELSDSMIAQHCGVSQPFVSKLRSTYNGYKSEQRTGVDGRTINTAKIGKKPTPADDPPLTDDELLALSKLGWEFVRDEPSRVGPLLIFRDTRRVDDDDQADWSQTDRRTAGGWRVLLELEGTAVRSSEPTPQSAPAAREQPGDYRAALEQIHNLWKLIEGEPMTGNTVGEQSAVPRITETIRASQRLITNPVLIDELDEQLARWQAADEARRELIAAGWAVSFRETSGLWQAQKDETPPLAYASLSGLRETVLSSVMTRPADSAAPEPAQQASGPWRVDWLDVFDGSATWERLGDAERDAIARSAQIDDMVAAIYDESTAGGDLEGEIVALALGGVLYRKAA